MKESIKIATRLQFNSGIPVVSKDNKPLMPCKPSKAKKLLNSGRAVPRWSKLGLFYIQLTIEIKSEYNTNQSFIELLRENPPPSGGGMKAAFFAGE